jgi:carbon-monoxide dehydrogenase medium subunit
MIPAQFDYVRPSSLSEACQELASDEDAKALAGGQSLLPLLRLRLAYPSKLVDIGRLPELMGVHDRGDHVFIGAMATHDEVMRSGVVNAECPLVALATATVADPAVRHRGTLGGALTHADPAGDLPAVALALDAQFVIAGAGGERRTVPAAEFFSDYLETAVGPGEILVEIRVPVLGPEWGTTYEKFNRVAQAWAIVGVAALVRREGDSIAEARIGLTNMGPTPLRATATEQALVGVSVHNGGIAQAARLADQDTEPSGDLSAQPDYRRHLARVLTGGGVTQGVSVTS